MGWGDDEPADLGRLLSAAEAERHLGIRAVNVRTWAHRGKCGLYSHGHDRSGRPLYWEADLLAAAAGVPIYDPTGRRAVRGMPTPR